MQRLEGWVEQGGHNVSVPGGTAASTTEWQRSHISATVTVYTAGTADLVTIYADNESTAKANPFTAATDGYWYFYATNGRYDVRFSGGDITTPFTLGDLVANDFTEATMTYQAVDFSATPIFDCRDASIFSITLTGNVTSSTVSNAQTGRVIAFSIKQDGTGGWTFAWPSNFLRPPTVPAAASAVMNASFFYDGTYWRQYATTGDSLMPHSTGQNLGEDTLGWTVTAKTLNNIRFADQFVGANGGAKIIAAIAAAVVAGTPEVDATALIGAQTATSVIEIPKGIRLKLGGKTTWSSSHATALFQITGDADGAGALIQEPGGILQYTGAGAGILISPGDSDAEINGGTIDIDTIDCNATGAYGIQFKGVGWAQRWRIEAKQIVHFATAGLDFQGGRKNGNFIKIGDVNGMNVAGTAELGTYGVYFEDAAALEAGAYKNYEANHIEISNIRNTTSYMLVSDFYCNHNYYLIDCGNDFSTVTTPIYEEGARNTFVVKAVNPWTHLYDAAAAGGAQTWYPSIEFGPNNLAGSTVVMPPALAGGIIDRDLLGFAHNVSVPEGDESFVINGSFENLDGTYCLGWTTSSVTAANIANQSKHGKSVLELTVAATTVGYAYQALPATLAGRTVIACGWVKNGNTGATTGQQGIAIYDDVGIGAETENYIIKPNTADDWYYLCVTKTIPAGATTIQLRLYADRAGTAAAEQAPLFDGVGVYIGVQPFMPSTNQSGAAGKTLLVGPVGIGKVPPAGLTYFSGAVPEYYSENSTAGVDDGLWRWYIDNSGTLRLQALNDARSAATTPITISRTNETVTGMDFWPSITTPALTVNSGTTIKKISVFTSVTVDFPEIAATSRGSIEVTISGTPGIAVGDEITVISGPEDLEDDIIYIGAKATDTDKVTFYAYNPTAGAINPASLNDWVIKWTDVT